MCRCSKQTYQTRKKSSGGKTCQTAYREKNKRLSCSLLFGKANLADKRGELALIEFKTINDNALFGPALLEILFRQEFPKLQMKFNNVDEALKKYLLLTKMDANNPDKFLEC